MRAIKTYRIRNPRSKRCGRSDFTTTARLADLRALRDPHEGVVGYGLKCQQRSRMRPVISYYRRLCACFPAVCYPLALHKVPAGAHDAFGNRATAGVRRSVCLSTLYLARGLVRLPAVSRRRLPQASYGSTRTQGAAGTQACTCDALIKYSDTNGERIRNPEAGRFIHWRYRSVCGSRSRHNCRRSDRQRGRSKATSRCPVLIRSPDFGLGIGSCAAWDRKLARSSSLRPFV